MRGGDWMKLDCVLLLRCGVQGKAGRGISQTGSVESFSCRHRIQFTQSVRIFGLKIQLKKSLHNYIITYELI